MSGSTPVRSTAISFFMLAAYPLALAFVFDRHQLLFVSVYFGLAHAGASVRWTVGPVSMAWLSAIIATRHAIWQEIRQIWRGRRASP